MSPKILLVDDSPINITLMQDILQTKSYEIECAYDGEQALKKVKTWKPSLILLDIQMGRMNGTETMEQIRAIEGMQNVPIIAVTAFSLKGDRDKYLKNGFSEYVSKPISIPEFLKMVEKFIPAEA